MTVIDATTRNGDRTAPDTARSLPDYDRPAWQRFLLTPESAIIALFIVVYAVAAVSINGFARPVTITYLLLDVAPILMIALPMALIMVTGEIDLSVASVVGLASVTTGLLTAAGVPFSVAALVAILVGAACGAFNGILVTAVGLPSLAVTIGTLALFRGLAVGGLGTQAVTSFPEAWTSFATSRLGASPIPTITLVLLVLVLLFAVTMHFTAFGRGVFAIGRGAQAAHFSGVRVQRTKLTLFILSGVVAALAGVYYTLRYGSARGDNATGLELQVIAAVVLGGVSVFGGRGALHGVIAGVLLIGALASALRLAGVTSDVINIITGVLLVVSVTVSALLERLSRRRRGGRASPTGPVPRTPTG